MDDSRSEDPLIGRTVGGSYVIRELVGVGGMGRVYRAEQRTLGRTVAVKVIHTHLLSDEQTVARFYTEARASSRLNHPNSVGVIDFGRTDDGILYLVMEFLDGADLAMVLADEGALPIPRIAEIMIGVLDALGEAHALDVVHRDLKPENVILKPLRDGRELVKVVDFGLATIASSETSITRPGLVCGTPDYMAPEQGRGETVDGRADIYACGVLLFELLTDALPFDADTPTKVVLRHLNDPIPDPREAAPYREISEGVAKLVMRALAKNPAERFQTAAEMIQAIREEMQKKQPAIAPAWKDCRHCGVPNPVSMRFCGSCGKRVELTSTSLPAVQRETQATLRPFYVPTLATYRPLIGRDHELMQLDAIRGDAATRAQWIHVHGEAGVGRSRLLREVSEKFAALGDIVIGAGPSPYGAPVPYAAIRTLIRSLLEAGENRVDAIIASVETCTFARAGFAELREPKGTSGLQSVPKTAAAAAALATALNATKIANSRRIVLIVDDIDRCDALTQATLAALVDHENPAGVLVLTSGIRPIEGREGIALVGFSSEETQRFLDLRKSDQPSLTSSLPPETHQRAMLPLYLEQLQLLDEHVGGQLRTAPRTTADVIAQRLERLGPHARKLLQTLAVYGGKVPLDALREFARVEDQSVALAGLDELSVSALVQISKSDVEVTHPMITEIVEAFIPASARAELHRRVLETDYGKSEPLEVLAEHAYRADELMRSLMTLERAGKAANERADHQAAVRFFRRGLELARRESLESGDAFMDGARATFSRKLGWALTGAGDLMGGEGVLREAMALVGPADPIRGQLNLTLGKVASARGKRDEAMRCYGIAMELLTGVDARAEADLQFSLGRLRVERDEFGPAGRAFRRAIELFEQLGEGESRALSLYELACIQVPIGEPAAARTLGQEAKQLAVESGAGGIASDAEGLLGRLAELEHEPELALRHYEEALSLAKSAGDAERQKKWCATIERVGRAR